MTIEDLKKLPVWKQRKIRRELKRMNTPIEPRKIHVKELVGWRSEHRETFIGDCVDCVL